MNELSNIKGSLSENKNNIKSKLFKLDMISDKTIKDIKVRDYKN